MYVERAFGQLRRSDEQERRERQQAAAGCTHVDALQPAFDGNPR